MRQWAFAGQDLSGGLLSSSSSSSSSSSCCCVIHLFPRAFFLYSLSLVGAYSEISDQLKPMASSRN
jgi:hypothetical protein